ncbi:hypothetical protein ACTQV0_12415 [Selenomonas montiformis]|uniref:hypothetical protein n=1 Tax=Selenomonas montiformis TaxID=2652285 RepID=UPI003F8BCB10
MSSLDELAKKMPEHDRLILGGIVGSFNYGLDDTLSDTDIRYYVMPTLDDLVRGRKKRRIFLDGERDIQIHDIRRFPYFLNMGDLNQISVLFSPRLYIGESYIRLSYLLLERREEIAEAVSSNIYNWGKSMFEKKMGQLDSFKLNEIVYQRNEYNTKAAAQAIYHIKMIGKYLHNLEYQVNNPLENALNCRDIREEILAVKDGKYTRDEFLKMADDAFSSYAVIDWNSPSNTPGWVASAINDEIKKHIVD